ncbi:MAG: GTP-binding protein [Cyanobacteria bacterium SBLK]|nr:GTP-binding protein [Cyanobacteria bacterium SBLK]
MAKQTDIAKTLQQLLDTSIVPIETELAAIIPTGSSFAYALSEEGEISGLKVGLRPINARKGLKIGKNFFEWLYAQNFLKRLVFPFSFHLPYGISKLNHLQFLYIHGCRSLPKDIIDFEIPIVTDSIDDFMIDERSNRIRWKEEEDLITYLNLYPNVRRYFLDITGIFVGSKLQNPPLEIVARGREAVISYFVARSTRERELNEVKFLLVGHGGAGKTSLLKALLKEPFDSNESQTHGINIHSLYHTTASNRLVVLKSWDFGGQEIMHATHQFFLSKRSVYIVVLDGRKEEQAEYWLKHVQAFGGDAPVIVVLNKSDENRGYDVNRKFLRQKYPGIVEFVRVSCLSKTGLDELREAISQALDRVELLKTRWPQSWLNVKEKLEDMEQPFIDLIAY